MSSKNCVIVGASHAGVSLALQLRKEGWQGGIKLLGMETELPYHRPPLSKDLLAGVKELDTIRLRPEKIYQDNEIDLMLGAHVEAIDVEAKLINLSSDAQEPFEKLALCTGASVRRLPLGESATNVHYIRAAEDVARVKAQLGSTRKVVIIGAGYIGLEAAAVLVQSGLDVTVLEMADRVLERVTSPVMSTYMNTLHSSHGVNIHTSTAVVDLEGDDIISAVLCADGSSHTCDMVLIGVGVTPNTELAEMAGLAVDNGVLVNEYCQSSDADIYASGDCSRFPSAIYGRTMRLESVQNANDQSRAAAANICGKQTAYDAVPWFWSDQYNIKLQMAGVNEGYDEVVCRGSADHDSDDGFALFYLQDGVVVAADCVGRPKEFMVAKQLVKNKSCIDSSRLQDETVEPASFLT